MTQHVSRNAPAPVWAGLVLGVLLRRPDRAIAIAYWYLTRRRLRARNRLRDAAIDLLPVYATWIRLVERTEVSDLLADAERGAADDRPRFSILLDASEWTSKAALERSVASLCRQSCSDWEVIVTGFAEAVPIPVPAEFAVTYLAGREADAAGRLGSALAAAVGDFVILLPPGAVLPTWAIARYRRAAQDHPGTAVFYGDEDVVDAAGRRAKPWFKPQWNAEMILALDYVSHACAIATSRARVAWASMEDATGCPGYALVLGVAGQPGAEVRHIAHVLCHMSDRPARADPAARKRIVARHVGALGGIAEVGPFDTVRVHWALHVPAPAVTILVPTRDRVDLLEACVGSLLRETRYPDYDVVVVDNGSVEPETAAWFSAITADPRVSVLRYDHPYNYSAINNFAAARARGAYLCLLNNDTEVIDGAWLDELMRYATKPAVGAVGAKLLYEDGTIQHAGVVMGLGDAAGHAHRGLPDDALGYFAQAHVAHYASAVTAACLVVDRAKFDAVGGLDETDLQIAYNDVDFCLKLQRAGWRNVYAPQAVLFHHESKSRGLDLSPKHVERYMRELSVLQERWGTTEVVDPLHHPRLDRARETYRIRL